MIWRSIHEEILTPTAADKKRVEVGKGDDSDDSDRPKKKTSVKANGKSKNRRK